MKRRLYTVMLKRRVRLTGRSPNDQHAARIGKVVNVYLVGGKVLYTVMLKDGRLIETDGRGVVVED